MRREWLERDYYEILGVEKDASDKAIKKAFRALAQQNHPDANQGDATAEARFKDINEAYEVLGDKEMRAEYDRVRDMGYFVGGQGQEGQPYVRVEDLLGGMGGAGSQFDLSQPADPDRRPDSQREDSPRSRRRHAHPGERQGGTRNQRGTSGRSVSHGQRGDTSPL
jgi:DnaJ-class molecular chaperone